MLVEKWAHVAPENLVFVPQGKLTEFATSGRCSFATLQVIISELIVRWCLSRSRVADDCLACLLKTDWEDFKDWYRIECVTSVDKILPASIWRGVSEISKACEGMVRTRLKTLFSIDGFIPVVENNEVASFLPFELSDSDTTKLVDVDGMELGEWSSSIHLALEPTEKVLCRVLCRGTCGLSAFVGKSFMLPVRLAYLRRKGLIPAYDRLRMVATGALGPDGALLPVKDSLKIEEFGRSFKDAVFFCPWSETSVMDPPCVRRLDCRDGLDSLAMVISRELESAGLINPDLKYVLKRMPEIERDVQSENLSQWEKMVGRVTVLERAVDEFRNPEELLFLRMLRAAALRHAGRSDEARQATESAFSFAVGRGWKEQALQLQIDSLVISQDNGDFESVRQLAETLAMHFDGEGNTVNDFLAMRYFGTMGQAHVWGKIAGVPGFAAEEGLRFFDRAIKSAISTGDETEIARDYNYRHLWFAFNDPGSSAEEDAYRRALNQIEGNVCNEKAKRKNLYYLLRQKSLAYFQHWKQTGGLPDMDDLGSVKLPRSIVDGWLCASNRRCIGAILAASGDVERAREMFADGDAALPQSDCCNSPVLSYVRMALLIQAHASLGSVDETDVANSYFEKAKELNAVMSQSQLFTAMRIAEWLEVKTCDPRDLPNVYY